MSLRKSPGLTPQLLAAARQNAPHSTGRRSPAAKQNSRLNLATSRAPLLIKAAVRRWKVPRRFSTHAVVASSGMRCPSKRQSFPRKRESAATFRPGSSRV